jgi:hypothetical protein
MDKISRCVLSKKSVPVSPGPQSVICTAVRQVKVVRPSCRTVCHCVVVFVNPPSSLLLQKYRPDPPAVP